MEIAYQLMMATYKTFKKPEDAFFPDEWLTTDEEKLKETYEELKESFLDQVFGSQSKLSKEEFIELLKATNKGWLQPHFIRQEVFQKLAKSKQ